VQKPVVPKPAARPSDAAAREAAVAEAVKGPVTVRPVTKQEHRRWHELLAEHHYLGDCQLVGEQVCHVAEAGGQWVGVIGWAGASLHNAVRDAHIGWTKQAKEQGLGMIANNVRFLLLPGAHTPNMASRVLGASLRRLSADFEALYRHPLVLAETFVDETRFEGTCYKASNWERVGLSKGWSKHGRKYEHHGVQKAVYLHPLNGQWREILRTPGRWRRSTDPLIAVRGIERDERLINGHGGLFAELAKVTEVRKARGIRYSMQTVLAVAICAVLAGAKTFIEIEEWAEDQPEDVRRRLGCRTGRPPRERTFRRILATVNSREIDGIVGRWLVAQRDLPGKAIAFDGKTLRGSGHGKRGKPVHLLAAVVHGSGEVIAQVPVDSKTNEITCVESLFAGIDLHGVVVTADALLTQQNVVRHVVEEKGGDYVFTVKDNQPTMKKDIADLHLEAFPPAGHDGR
jgi:hypothetical protein